MGVLCQEGWGPLKYGTVWWQQQPQRHNDVGRFSVPGPIPHSAINYHSPGVPLAPSACDVPSPSSTSKRAVASLQCSLYISINCQVLRLQGDRQIRDCRPSTLRLGLQGHKIAAEFALGSANNQSCYCCRMRPVVTTVFPAQTYKPVAILDRLMRHPHFNVPGFYPNSSCTAPHRLAVWPII
jgi:hypothetical protein